MHPRDWKKFFEQGQNSLIQPAQVSDKIVDYLGATSRNLILHHDYVLKAVEKHEMPFNQFPMIFETVERGVAIKDKPRHVTMFYFDEHEWKRWFHVTLKVAGEDRRLYLCTFYKTDYIEVNRRLKKAEKI